MSNQDPWVFNSSLLGPQEVRVFPAYQVPAVFHVPAHALDLVSTRTFSRDEIALVADRGNRGSRT